MSGGSPDGPRSGILPTLIIGGVAVIVALTLIGWVIGAILSVLRLVVIVVVAGAVIYAIGSARSDR